MVNRCLATNAEGASCQSQPVRPSGYCYWHDPSVAEERDRKRREGGANRSNRIRAKRALPDAVLSPIELQGLLCTTLKAVIAGRLEPGVGNAAAALARAVVTVREATTLEERIKALEAAVDLGGRRHA
jgi:hypothetical protein